MVPAPSYATRVSLPPSIPADVKSSATAVPLGLMMVTLHLIGLE